MWLDTPTSALTETTILYYEKITLLFDISAIAIFKSLTRV